MRHKQFFKVDVNGIIVNSITLDTEDPNTIVPENHYEGWGVNRGLFDPVYDFNLGDWVEGKLIDEIEYERTKTVDLELMQKELSYLRETDWYPIRAFENGKNTPSDIITNRGNSRDIISDIRLKYNLGGN